MTFRERLDRKRALKKAYQEDFKKFLKKEKEKEAVIDHNFDIAYLEEIVQQCNQNPYLLFTVTLSDGTKFELKTVKEKNEQDLLFTEAVYKE